MCEGLVRTSEAVRELTGSRRRRIRVRPGELPTYRRRRGDCMGSETGSVRSFLCGSWFVAGPGLPRWRLEGHRDRIVSSSYRSTRGSSGPLAADG